MMGRLRIGFLALLIVAISAAPAAAQGSRTCASCHSDEVYAKGFYRSVHGANGCTSCHRGISDLAKHAAGEERLGQVNCGLCHREAAQRFKRDVHAIKLNIACADCHRDIHRLKKRGEESKIAVQASCTACHVKEDYALMGHGRAVAAGNQDTATCTDCHSLHAISYAAPGSERDAAAARESYTRRCRACHADRNIAKRNDLSTRTVLAFDETHHGKVLALGYPQKVAGCADCHTGHNTLKKNDPRSSLHPAELAASCRTCHAGASPRFAAYDAHPNPSDSGRSLALYGTHVFMAALLAGTFLFFWTHLALWWRRLWLERGCRAAVPCADDGAEGRHVRRFSPRERGMHVVLILSFFTLVLTGFPLKYADAAWAKPLMSFWGGAYRAGLVHRAAATVLSVLFLYTCWLSVTFLFPGWKREGWRERLFGPDSLFPNLQDLRDVVGMFRWFVGRGPQPRFDRWTYWEKFDFLAVFWGMAAIGGSGLVLWFPELFSWILPGWLFNVAQIVHSEEALLAAIFIFTVHFFNTHLVPTKFPLESNIFTGLYPLASLREDRPLEYDRLAASGRLETLMAPPAGPWTRLAASAFGLACVLLGLALAALILWAAL